MGWAMWARQVTGAEVSACNPNWRFCHLLSWFWGRTQMPLQEEGRNSTQAEHRAPLLCQGLCLARKISRMCHAQACWVTGLCRRCNYRWKAIISCFTHRIYSEATPATSQVTVAPSLRVHDTESACFILPRRRALLGSLKHKAECHHA